MDSACRRNQIVSILKEASAAVTGTELSKQCNVSRQIIVGDVAILRAQGMAIISTPRGYQLVPSDQGGIQHVFVCCHDKDEMEAELNAIVDNGGIVHNVVVEHEVYGNLEGTLNLHSRRDVTQYVKRMEESHAQLLSAISGGIHTHLVEADSQEDMDAIGEALEALGVLYT
ncbi:MAG: transcription repressor NadR [Megasphaera sp.]|nr:transcription repressor NadR [Megasphaera sp.]MCH4188388.1 transcription repressor NadR [Megasphaera sp.]MCH4218227.1 transcription repressor NadR [Megasphaera sp.]